MPSANDYSLNVFRILLLISSCCFFCTRAIFLTSNETKAALRIENNPAVWTENDIWGSVLEDWVLGLPKNHREQRVVMNLPPKLESGFVVSEDFNAEGKRSPGKIVNNSNGRPPSNGGRPVTETDLYLLNAIEKLVYRLDFMEKRLRRVEEMAYYMMAGNRIDGPEPCPNNFTRVGVFCYTFNSKAGRELDWKAASKTCKQQGGFLAEMETIEEYQDVLAHIQTNGYLKGKDFWTGGLNPGLLWIWSNSARPVINPVNKKGSSIYGDGRCLRMGYDPSLRSYAYKGTDCAIRYHYICEIMENKTSNQIKRIGRAKNVFTDDSD